MLRPSPASSRVSAAALRWQLAAAIFALGSVPQPIRLTAQEVPPPDGQEELRRAVRCPRAEEPPAASAEVSDKDTIGFAIIACFVDQFDEAVPFGREIDGDNDRGLAPIEVDYARQALPLLKCRCERADINAASGGDRKFGLFGRGSCMLPFPRERLYIPTKRAEVMSDFAEILGHASGAGAAAVAQLVA